MFRNTKNSRSIIYGHLFKKYLSLCSIFLIIKQVSSQVESLCLTFLPRSDFEEINNMIKNVRKNRSAKCSDNENELVHITKEFYDEIREVASQKCNVNIQVY